MDTDLNSLSVEDVMANPKAFGMPTFDEFSKNPDKWRSKETELLDCMANGPSQFRKFLKSVTYEVLGFHASTEEEVERIIKNEGYSAAQVEMRPQMIPEIGGGYSLLVKITPKVKR